MNMQLMRLITTILYTQLFCREMSADIQFLCKADLLLVFPLPGAEQDIQGTPLGAQPLRLVPECSLSGVEELEEVAALSGTQELRVLRNKALDIKCDVL